MLSATRGTEGREEDPQWDAAKRGAKPEVMLFDGSLDPKKYMDWEVGLEEYFDWFHLPESRRVQFAQMKLAGQARIYWPNLLATAERRREPPVATWEEMKSRMRGKFVPACYRPMIIDEWQHLRHGDGSIAEYIARFDDLMIRCNLDEEPVATLARFRAGLRPEYQRELILQEVTTLEKAYRFTTNMELYSSHAQRNPTLWYCTPDTVRTLPPVPALNPLNPQGPPPPQHTDPHHSTPASPTPTTAPSTPSSTHRGSRNTTAGRIRKSCWIFGDSPTDQNGDDGQPPRMNYRGAKSGWNSTKAFIRAITDSELASCLFQMSGMGSFHVPVPVSTASRAPCEGPSRRDTR